MMAMSLLVLLLVCFSGLSAAEFLRVPENQSVGLGLDAVFHCQHRAALSIGWLVDGVSENQLDNSGTYIKSGNYRDENNSLIYTLTILARPEYNETMIECVATFLDSLPQRSPPVTLIIEDSCGSLSVATAFTIMPLPEGVFADGSDARFECYHRASNRITFKINGLSVNDTIGQNASIITIAAGNGRSMFILEFEATQVLDGSMIVCIAIFANGCPDQPTVPALLLIQGPLSAVTRFRRLPSDQVVYLWTPPPTLPLTGVTTYIVYSFEVYNITCGANDLLISFYNLSGASYRNVLLDPGHVYKVIIIPRSNVPGAKNGTAHVECERFAKVNVSSVVSMENSLGVVVEFSLESIMDTMNIHARWYSLLLQVVDQPEKRMVLDMDEMMDTTVHVLARRQLFLVTVMAYDCEEHQVSETTIISTHDVQEVSARPITGGINVTGHFITSSSAVGICIIVFSFANEADVNYVFVQRPKEQQEIETTFTGLSVGDYQVSVFVVDNSGLPFNQSADLPSNVSVSEDIKLTETAETMDDQSVILYELQANSTGVYITCTFLDSSTNTCVAVVHQRISQLSSSGLMNIELSRKFSKSGDTAYGCIEGVNMEQYQVGVINGKRIITVSDKDSSLASLAGAIAGTVLGIIVFALIVAVVVIVFVRRRPHKTIQESLYSEVVQPPSRSDVIVKLEGGYNYLCVESAPLREEERERSVDEQPPLTPPLPPRVMADNVSTPPLPPRQGAATCWVIADAPGSAEGESHETNPPVRETSGDGSKDPTYATTVLLGSSNVVSPPATTEKLMYDDVKGFHNQLGQLYAIPHLKSTSKGTLDDFYKVEYSEIQPQQITQNERSSPDDSEQQSNIATVSPRALGSLTVQRLYCHLLPLSSKWQSLGEALSLDEDRLDEIFTNNETDEACLREMVELYMMRSDHNHNWEEIGAAEEKVMKEVVDQKQGDCVVEVPQKKSEKEQPAEIESLDSICPDSGHYSQSVPDGDCEFQCSMSTYTSASPTSVSQADEDGNISADIQKSNSSPESLALNGSTSSDLCASISSEKTSHIPDSATNPATTSWYEEAIEEKDVYNLNCDGSHNLGQSGNSFGDKQSDKESLQKGNGPSDYSQTALSDIEHSNDVAPSSQGEYPESKLAATLTGQSESSECGNAASNASGDDISVNQDECSSDHMHPSGKKAAQLNISAVPCIPTPTDPTKNEDLHQENINDVDQTPSNVFDIEMPCTCSSMNSYRYSQLKKFGLVVAEDYQDNEGPCKLDPVYCQGSH